MFGRNKTLGMPVARCQSRLRQASEGDFIGEFIEITRGKRIATVFSLFDCEAEEVVPLRKRGLHLLFRWGRLEVPVSV